MIFDFPLITFPAEPKIIQKEGNKTIFEISPLYPGYGVTVGNALRRILISSIEGAAITMIRIKSATHEFTTIPYVLEDVVDIVLNLKMVRFKFYGQEPVTLKLEATGKRKVTAGDIQTTADVKIVNKDQHIANLTDKKAEFNIELDVQKGMGFVPSEMHQKEKVPIGSIALDSIFSPCKHVNYKVETIRVGQRTDFNKLILEVETDGSVSPEVALKKAGDLLVQHFEIIRGPKESIEELEKQDLIKPNEKPVKKTKIKNPKTKKQ